MKLDSKVAIVTGGSRGIGKSISLALAHEGATVVVNYVQNKSAADAVVEEIISAGGQAIAYQCSVTVFEDVDKMVKDVIKQYGKIDILINNAGITRDGYLMTMKHENWQDVIDTNLLGAFNCTKAVSRYMIDKKSGCIINIASTAGLIGVPGQTNYCAAKAGLIGFSKALGREMATFNIRVNCVAPGFIETDMVKKLPEKMLQRYVANIPVKRMGQPEEVAKTVVFLASDDASYIIGEVIVVDGGVIA